MTRRYFRPLKPQTVIDTLHYVRQEMVREDRDGLEHVDYLLKMYGAEPLALNMPRKTAKAFRKGELRRMVLESLRDGPQTGRALAEAIHAQRPDLAFKQVYKRVYICLWTLKQRGLLTHKGQFWGSVSEYAAAV